MEDKQHIFWFQDEGEKKLATENLIPGNQVYNEKLLNVKGFGAISLFKKNYVDFWH